MKATNEITDYVLSDILNAKMPDPFDNFKLNRDIWSEIMQAFRQAETRRVVVNSDIGAGLANYDGTDDMALPLESLLFFMARKMQATIVIDAGFIERNRACGNLKKDVVDYFEAQTSGGQGFEALTPMDTGRRADFMVCITGESPALPPQNGGTRLVVNGLNRDQIEQLRHAIG